MPQTPNFGQLLLLGLAAALFLGSVVVSLVRPRRSDRQAVGRQFDSAGRRSATSKNPVNLPAPPGGLAAQSRSESAQVPPGIAVDDRPRPARRPAQGLAWLGMVTGAGVLAWHSATRGSWLPLEDNFDAFIWLAVLLAGLTLYLQARRPIAGLHWFSFPIVVLLLACAGIFGLTSPHAYDVKSLWAWTHRVTSYGGAVAFAVAGAVGVMYLIVSRRLRDKRIDLDTPNTFGSLERLEQVAYSAVTLGFGLLTIGLITGVAHIYDRGGKTALGAEWFLSPKVLLAVSGWVVYGLVLHAPLNPSFRGRRTAVLSIVGGLLIAATLVAVQLTAAGGGAMGETANGSPDGSVRQSSASSWSSGPGGGVVPAARPGGGDKSPGGP